MKQLLAVSALITLALAAGMVFSLEPLGLRYHLDADVYRLGARELLADAHLYTATYLTRVGPLPFTYPPFAALIFLPLAPLSDVGAGLVLTLVNLALPAVLAYLVLRHLRVARPGAWTLLLLPVMLVAEPVWETVAFGQINLVLATLVLVDALVLAPRGSRWRGLLTGLAAGVKLTPLVFILVPLFRRDLRGGAGVLAGFLGTGLLGALAAPQATREYLAGVLGDTGRIGNAEYAANQSLAGVFARVGVEQLWLPSLAVVGAAVVIALEREHRRGGDPLAMVLLASLVATLGSPVSWSHHWVWLVPTTIYLAVSGWRTRRRWSRLLAGLGAAAMLARPHWLLPHGGGTETAWPWWAQVVGSSYVVIGLVFLAAMTLRSRGTARAGGLSASRAAARSASNGATGAGSTTTSGRGSW
ncbi:glycosyltransferase 87 family protein [Corynebacterium guangdongense]|uniref:Alpha-1,2-mannosyltransferase n=1 Tax=Corynebacterium guangdongense TaxID=1783348 RepID=A0ABU1ZZS0_9CORY|nr:glycosyltransferase 87 family protein [Corynebacterium guangdongense]MDR7329757.1 alpha-1,2-mannosyltransferase [Corynebacterium guangdongense]WJZ18321.1 Polyprenol-phosphate-mannose-dependent alpha-(1-2)-phosphatidylinositol mannoside mannosyltransferase [Corynebacterium guangdongense]